MEKRDRVYRDWIEGLELGIAGVSPDGTVRYANSRFAEILGITSAVNLRGKKLTNYIAASSAHDLHSALAASKDGRVEGEIQILNNKKLRIIGATFDRTPGGIKTIRMVISEIAKAAETKRTLQRYEQSVRSLSARILQLQDEERRRIARELHDTSGQDLAVILISLSQISSQLEKNGVPEEIRQKLSDAASMARKVEDQIRTLSYLLHPPLLDELGLSAALRWYVEGFKKRTNIAVELSAPEGFPRLAPEHETALFRVIQECLSNILRHADSCRARLRLSFADQTAEISIRDYGKGIPTQRLTEAAGGKSLGVGIAGMRERLQQLGGNLEIRSSQRGTLVIARVPIEVRRAPGQEAASVFPASQAPAAGAEAAKQILIADDHEVTRHGIKALLQNEPDLQVCGEAEDGAQAIAKTIELQPDLVLLDLSMPKAGGFRAIKQIRESSTSTKILVFTTHAYAHLVSLLHAAGCDGYLYKGKASDELVRAIRTVLAGNKFFLAEEGADESSLRALSANG